MSRRFEILPDAPNDLARPFLRTDVVWNCFSLADLEPPYREYARIPLGRERDSRIVAACLVYDRPGDRSIVPFGNAEGVRAILASIELPSEAFLMLRDEEDWPVLAEQFEAVGPFNPMLRMTLTKDSLKPVSAPDGISITPVARESYPEVDALYAEEPASRMAADHYPEGAIVGARDADGRLCSVAAAMAVNPIDRIGIVGGVFTRSDARGRGLAKATSSAVCARLFDLGCDLVLLNVLRENEAARRVYLTLGFTERLRYSTVHGRRRTDGE